MFLSPSDGVDVWVSTLPTDSVVEPGALHDDADVARAHMIIPPARRRLFLFRRAVQHFVLGRYLGTHTIFAAARHKPVLFEGDRRSVVHYSASSAGEVCAIGVSSRPVGVDVERRRPRVDLVALCERFVPGFSGLTVADEPLEARRLVAVCSWCRLESFAKLHEQPLHSALFGRGDVALPWSPSMQRRGAIVIGAAYVCAIAQTIDVTVQRVFDVDYNALNRGDTNDCATCLTIRASDVPSAR